MKKDLIYVPLIEKLTLVVANNLFVKGDFEELMMIDDINCD
jgi:hypothetical protein